MVSVTSNEMPPLIYLIDLRTNHRVDESFF